MKQFYFVICLKKFDNVFDFYNQTTGWTWQIPVEGEILSFCVWEGVHACVLLGLCECKHVCVCLCACVCVHACVCVCLIHLFDQDLKKSF